LNLSDLPPMKEDLNFRLQKIADGDEKVFRALFDQFSPRVFVFAMKLTRSRSMAEEVVQEIFIKIWDNRERLRDVEYFPSYLSVITRNHCFNVLKKLAVESRVNGDFSKQIPLVHRETEDQVIYKDYQEILARIVNTLPPQQKSVYSLCHGQGMKYEEAAQHLNISRLTVKAHMQLAMKTIRTRFGNFVHYAIFLGLLPF
jgi:RNA polymerase sigma-70 factor (family 1)